MDLEYRIRKLFNLPEAFQCGYSENEMEQAEKKLSVKFLQTPRNYYLLFGKNRRLDRVVKKLQLLYNNRLKNNKKCRL
jgi:hypothetical protein